MEVSSNFYQVLFNRSKIIRPDDTVATTATESSDPQRRVSILLKDPSAATQQEMIRKIMAACQLQPEDYSLNAARPWKAIRSKKLPEVVLLFGVSESELGLTLRFPLHRRCTFDGRVWIKSLDIEQIMQRRELKNELWKNALKPFFLG